MLFLDSFSLLVDLYHLMRSRLGFFFSRPPLPPHGGFSEGPLSRDAMEQGRALVRAPVRARARARCCAGLRLFVG